MDECKNKFEMIFLVLVECSGELMDRFISENFIQIVSIYERMRCRKTTIKKNGNLNMSHLAAEFSGSVVEMFNRS